MVYDTTLTRDDEQCAAFTLNKISGRIDDGAFGTITITSTEANTSVPQLTGAGGSLADR